MVAFKALRRNGAGYAQIAATDQIVGAADVMTVQALGAPAVRATSDRANDFVMLADYKDAADGTNFGPRFPRAVTALLAKGGGYLRMGRDTVDLGSGTLSLTDNNIIFEGEGATTIASTAASGPVVQMGSGGSNNPNFTKLRRCRVQGSTAGRTGPTLWLRNGYDQLVEEVILQGHHDTAIAIDGGTNGYSQRLKRVSVFGDCNDAIVLGKNAQAINVYLDEWQAGGATGAGILGVDVSGLFIGPGEALGCRWGMKAIPGPGQLFQAVRTYGQPFFDTNKEEGILITDAGGFVQHVQLAGSWICSNGTQGTNKPGVSIVGSSANTVSTIDLSNACIGNNGGQGVVVINADAIEFNGTDVGGNGTTTAAPGYYFGPQARNCKVSGGRSRGQFAKFAPFTAVRQSYGAILDTGSDYISITGRVDMTGNQNTGAAAVLNASGGANNSAVNGSGFYG